MSSWVYNDGGRAAAGMHGKGNDCAVRAIAIATGLDYVAIYRDLAPHVGTYRAVWQSYLESLGWFWAPTMQVGDPARVRMEDLPAGRLVVMTRGHLCAVIDGVIHDTFDCSLDGKRVVYGYMTPRHSCDLGEA